MLRDPQISQFSLRIPRSLAAGSSGGLPLRGTGRQAGRQGGREGESEETGQGLLLKFFDPARTKDQEFVPMIFLFFFFLALFYFLFWRGGKFLILATPQKKKKKS
jgi:hypothetical protein